MFLSSSLLSSEPLVRLFSLSSPLPGLFRLQSLPFLLDWNKKKMSLTPFKDNAFLLLQGGEYIGLFLSPPYALPSGVVICLSQKFLPPFPASVDLLSWNFKCHLFTFFPCSQKSLRGSLPSRDRFCFLASFLLLSSWHCGFNSGTAGLLGLCLLHSQGFSIGLLHLFQQILEHH